jgi:hypothetical protein
MVPAMVCRSGIEAALDRYVRSAAMPCPYARSPTRYLHLNVELDSPEARPVLHRALGGFYEHRSSLVLCVVPTPQPQDHRAARAQAYQLRRQLHQLHLEVTGATAGRAEEVAARLRAQYRAWSDDLPSFLGPRVLIGSIDIMTTAFNPCYPNEHPRYAPYACLVVIRTEDLRAIHDKRPELSRAIAVHAKCKLLRSTLRDTTGIELAAMREEYPAWLRLLGFYEDFVTTHYTAGYRMDPQTLPRLQQIRQNCAEAMASDHFLASLIAFRAMACSSPETPTLAQILAENPDVSVFDVAKIIFGDVSGMYVPV